MIPVDMFKACLTENPKSRQSAAGVRFGFQIGAVLRPASSPETRNVIPNQLRLPHTLPPPAPSTTPRGNHVSREIALGRQ
jgi:hypothetical protein